MDNYYWKLVISELLVNLAAAWFGVTFIGPTFGQVAISLLLFQLIVGIVFMYLGYVMRKEAGR